MSEENQVAEVNPSLDESVNIEDLFSAMDDENALNSQRPEDEDVETENPEDVKAQVAEETDEKEEPTEELKDWELKYKELEESMGKRLKDTQSFAHKANKANNRVLEKLSQGEELTEEDIKSLKADEPDSPDAVATMISTVNDTLPIAKAIVSQMSGRDMDSIEGDISAFNELARFDPTLVETLMGSPENDRAAYVIKRGGELKEVFDIVTENGGSVCKAIANAGAISTRKTNKLREEITAQVTKEYEEKYKNYVTSGSSKPTMRGTAPKKNSSNAVDHGAVTSSDLF